MFLFLYIWNYSFFIMYTFIFLANDINFSGSISPDELLIALHTIDPAEGECDMKTVIKGRWVLQPFFVI